MKLNIKAFAFAAGLLWGGAIRIRGVACGVGPSPVPQLGQGQDALDSSVGHVKTASATMMYARALSTSDWPTVTAANTAPPRPADSSRSFGNLRPEPDRQRPESL